MIIIRIGKLILFLLFPRQYFPLFNIMTKKRKYIYSFFKNAIIDKGDDRCGNIL